MLLRRCCPAVAFAALLVLLTTLSTHAAGLPALVSATTSPTGEYVTRPDIDAPTLTSTGTGTGTGEQAPGLLLTTPSTFSALDFEAIVHDAGLIEEHDGTGPVFMATFEAGHLTYRTERAEWHATPTTPPDAVLGQPAEDGGQTMYMSWNGATDVTRWRIEAGPTEEELRHVGTAPSRGFETVVELRPPDDSQVFRVTALDPSGAPLGSHTLIQ